MIGLSGHKSKKISGAKHWKLELMKRFIFRAELSTSQPPGTDFTPGREVGHGRHTGGGEVSAQMAKDQSHKPEKSL